MITDQDVQKLKKTFATKDDLKGFATKDDLKELKGDIQNMSDKIIEAMQDMLSTKADSDDLNEQHRQLDNHETRILALEVK